MNNNQNLQTQSPWNPVRLTSNLRHATKNVSAAISSAASQPARRDAYACIAP
jgi:hypothetical protein